jgi:hypothetical protein
MKPWARVEAYFIKADSLGNFDTALVAIKEEQLDIKVFPNPGSDFLTIENSNSLEYVFELYTIEGKPVLSQDGFGELTIKTNSLTNGVYLYRLIQNKQVLQQGKWIKSSR